MNPKHVYQKYGKKEQIYAEYEMLTALQRELEAEKQRFFPKVYGWERGEEKSCLNIEYLEGKTLAEIWKEREGRISKEEFLFWMEETAEGLCCIHQMRPAILWCDCKPSNLMLSHGQIKLIDFDAAYRFTATVPLRSYGTEEFSAPEQRNGGILDERTDIYGYGVTFQTLLPRTFDFHLRRILKRCMKTKREQRFQTAAELLYEIRKRDKIRF